MVKNLILGIRPIGPKIKPQIVFSNIWSHQSLDIMFSYHHLQYQTQSYNDPILRKLSHGRMDRQTDRQRDRQTDCETDRSDFTGCCATNAEHPIMKNILK